MFEFAQWIILIVVVAYLLKRDFPQYWQELKGKFTD